MAAEFATWDDLLAYISTSGKAGYHAPLDYRGRLVNVKAFKNGKVRVSSPFGDFPSFTADSGHLKRFYRLNAMAESFRMVTGE